MERQNLRVMLVEEDPHRLKWVMRALAEAGVDVVAHGGSLLELERAVARDQPDVIIIEAESPSRDTLEQLCVFSPLCPTPIVFFTDDSDTAKIRRAVQAGVSAYVVSGLSAERVRPVLEAAVTRFESYRELTRELARTKTTLEEKELIDRAKRQLIRRLSCTEEEAYHSLRRMAMDQQCTLAKAARRVLRGST
jgi:two-component system, response regulator / RNA-binding antiterminator